MPTVAFDVDQTLITCKLKVEGGILIPEGPDIPRYEVIELFRKFKKFGCQMFVWSGGGVDYAKQWAEKLGLEATAVAKGSFKPDIAVDDQDVTLGTVNIKV
jgi:phosphoserine phosphatase